MSDKTVSIYALINPETRTLFYIGKTKNRIGDRLNGHLTAARKGSRTLVSCVIRALLDHGVKPRIEVIKVVQMEGWKKWEVLFIEIAQLMGHTLANQRPGGC